MESLAEVRFRQIWPVSKDMQSFRPPRGTPSPDRLGGVILEDIEEQIRLLVGPMKTDDRIKIVKEWSPIPYMEYALVNERGNAGIYSYSARVGIPTLIFGCETEEQWRFLWHQLSADGWLREPA